MIDIDYIRKNIKQIREIKNLSQREVATKLGITTNGYQKMENGEVVINLERLHQIAEIFDMSVTDIINYPNVGTADNERVKELEKELIESKNLLIETLSTNNHTIKTLMEKIQSLEETLKARSYTSDTHASIAIYLLTNLKKILAKNISLERKVNECNDFIAMFNNMTLGFYSNDNETIELKNRYSFELGIVVFPKKNEGAT